MAWTMLMNSRNTNAATEEKGLQAVKEIIG
jgi:hypothetical protein